jgi:shikimate kinase
MQVVYLYAPMGVGKLTVGRELARLTGFKLLHNHLFADVATQLFAHETQPYFHLLRLTRENTFASAAREDVSFIATGVYRGTREQDAAIMRSLAPIYEAGGSVLFVQLTCEREVWLERLQSPARAPLKKITEPRIVLDLLAQFDLFATMPFEPGLTIDTTRLSPTETALQIVAQGSLPTVEDRA